jgi:hypothetical protein
MALTWQGLHSSGGHTTLPTSNSGFHVRDTSHHCMCRAYTLVGTSRQLAVGPVAVTSLLINSSMKKIVPCVNAITNPNNPGTPELVRDETR